MEQTVEPWQEPEDRSFKAARKAFLIADAALVLIILCVVSILAPVAPPFLIGDAFLWIIFLFFALLITYYIGLSFLLKSRGLPIAPCLIGVILIHFFGSKFVLDLSSRLATPSVYPGIDAQIIGCSVGLFLISLALSLFIENAKRQRRPQAS